MKRNIKYILIQFFVIFLSIEIILRLAGNFKTYSEKIGNGYTSYYGQILPTWYHHWQPSSQNCFNQTEFNYCYQYNSLGFRDIEWTVHKPASIKRIIILGDSFTEGDGAPDRENFPSHFENSLNIESNQWQVYNGGVCGSDPFFNFQFFNTKILPHYDYDLILLLVNNSDISDYIYRGGMERFKEDSTTHFRKAPWFEKFYHYSHFARGISKLAGFSDELISQSEKEEYQTKSLQEITETYRQISETTKKDNKKILVVIHTFPGTVNRKEANQDYINHLEPLLNELHIPYINICNKMENVFSEFEYDKYAWKKNGHFNSFGYKVFSDIIFEGANTKYPDLLN
jgi:hypothetical protein